jgi:glutathione S-transferase
VPDNDGMFILHHYEQSPYAHKIRAMFGLADARWGSVLSPPFPPRPNLEPLVGGYRRIPVAQHGADVFCDSALIAEELAAYTGRDELVPVEQAADALGARAEGAVFFAAITAIPPWKLLGGLVRSQGPLNTLKFVRDRTGMMKGSSARPPQGREAAQLFNAFLSDVDAHLAEQACVQGDAPGYADFCVYHPIWLARSVGAELSLKRHGRLAAWLQRMDDLGEGKRSELSPEQAFAAAEAEPRALPEDPGSHEALGRSVSIAPADYARIGSSGVLVAATGERYILRRDTERFGAVHVHFPVAGYALTV